MPKRTLLSFCLAVVVAVVFTVCDALLLHDIIPNRGPELTVYDLTKTVVALCLAIAIVASIHADGSRTRSGDALTVSRPWLVSASLALSIAFAALFLISPAAFNWLGSEDRPVEDLEALFGLVGAILFAGAALAARHLPEDAPNRRLAIAFATFCALVMFLLCMEEISWGQRIFGYSTPEGFEANRQGEANIHNFFTTPIHTVYRLGSWAVLVLLPFMVTFGPGLRLFDRFDRFLPPAWIAVLSAPVACFNYNTWPFLPTQVVVFASILIMAIFWRQATKAAHRDAWFYGAATLLIVILQSVFLIWGDRFVRHWDVTEYQEFFMPLGLATLGWVILERLRAASRSTERQLSGTRVGHHQ